MLCIRCIDSLLPFSAFDHSCCRFCNDSCKTFLRLDNERYIRICGEKCLINLLDKSKKEWDTGDGIADDMEVMLTFDESDDFD